MHDKMMKELKALKILIEIPSLRQMLPRTN